MEPIEVSATPNEAQIAAAIRQIILASGMIAGTLGYTQAFSEHMLNLGLALAGPIAALISAVIGQFHTRKTAQKMAIIAEAAPDDVARVKG
jgi:secreted protein with Ig-like and vWFA domain